MRRKGILSVVLMALSLLLVVSCATTPPPAPPTARDHFNWGLKQFNSGNFDAALGEFNTAASLDPHYIEAFYYLGQCYEKKEMWDHAEKAYASCVKLDNTYLKAREAWGILAFQRKKYSLAREQLEIAANLHSIRPRVYYCLGEIYRMDGKCKKAIASYNKALQLNSGFLDAKEGLRLAKIDCRKHKPRKKKVKVETTFTGGGKAIKPQNF